MTGLLTSNVVLAVSFVLFLVSLPLVSFGATDDQPLLWWLGLALMVIAGLIPPLVRYVPLADEDENGEDNEEPKEGGE
jgi:hypothetical protein